MIKKELGKLNISEIIELLEVLILSQMNLLNLFVVKIVITGLG